MTFTAWLLCLIACVLAVGGFNGPGRDLAVFLSVCVLAGTAIILFKFAHYCSTKRACPRTRSRRIIG